VFEGYSHVDPKLRAEEDTVDLMDK
jgi:hypothetical protein